MWKHYNVLLYLFIGVCVFHTVVSTENNEPVDENHCSCDTDEEGCGENEQYVDCVAGRCVPKNCSEIGYPIACPDVVEPCPGGCMCIDGYVWNKHGVCIPQDNCKEGCGGDPHAITGCGTYCGQRCSELNGKPRPCPKICKFNSCQCRDKYAYDENLKKCVKKKDCTPTCPQNEYYSTCRIAECRALNCSQVGKPIACPSILPPCNDGGCVCNQGYARLDNGTCVPVDKCPRQCTGSNEVYSTCPKTCPPQNCSSIGKVYHCPYQPTDGDKKNCKPQCVFKCKTNEEYDICPPTCPPESCTSVGLQFKCSAPPQPGDPKCKARCRCAKGYYRNSTGDCVSKSDCGCGGDPNAVKGCSNYCGKSCGDYNKTVICPEFCKVNGCACKEGYVYDPNVHKCVRPRDCTQQCTGSNEVYSACPKKCPFQTCSAIGEVVFCPRQPTPGDKDCNPQCICKENYYRNAENVCVPKDVCLKCNKTNEVYDNCAPTCPTENCPSRFKLLYKCPAQPMPGDPKCKARCRCAKGYYRNSTGDCVLESNCGCGGDPNAVSGCGNYCGNSCDDYNKTHACPASCIANGCACKKGYVYDRNIRKCVLPSECTKQCTGSNEVYNACPKTCPSQNCSSIGKVYHCPLQPTDGATYCKPQCVCKDNYYRNAENLCVPKDVCLKCNKTNEVYDSCAPTCPSENCTSAGKVYKCPAQPVPGDPKCQARCRCAKGYYRNSTGNCIPESNCGCGGDPNAGPGCSNYCGNSCDDYKKPHACPLFCVVNGCACNEGYVYDRSIRKCVLPCECTPQCNGTNEIYSACPKYCPSQACSAIGEKVFCPRQPSPGDKDCKPQCICQDNYYRNAENKCVPKAECLKCNKTNEVYDSCAPTCPPENCTTANRQYKCPAQPVPGDPKCEARCRCAKGYYRNCTDDCVPKSKCEKCKKPHEKYVVCPASCPGESCNVDPKTVRCAQPPQPGDPNCAPDGCRCESGYCRNDDGDCVKRDYLKKCKKPHEKYVFCPASCPGESCSVDPRTVRCAEPPQPGDPNCAPDGCQCESGYCRNDDGDCVIRDYLKECGENEEFVVCPPKCPGESCDVDPRVVLCMKSPEPGSPDCEPDACRCKSGYCRKNGVCVLRKEK